MRLARQMSSALVLLGIAPSGLSPAAPMPAVERHGVLVTVAEVSPERATLWLRGDRTATPVRLRYGPAEDSTVTIDIEVRLEPERDQTGRVVLDGLAPGTRYVY